MLTFAQKRTRLSSQVSVYLGKSMLPPAREAVPPILRLQRVIGNQEVQRLVRADLEGVKRVSDSPSTRGVPPALKPLNVGVRAFPEPRFGHTFSSRVRSANPGYARRHSAAFVSLPRLGGNESTISVTQPLSDDSKASAVPPAVQRKEDSCAVPFAMNKVTSGPFQGGYTMDDYHPRNKGKGLWSHPEAAGPFDTGAVAGVNVQLYGTFPSPCRPELFSLEQTVTDDKAIVDGAHEPTEGKTRDDIAETKNDPSGPPFRRDWLGGGYNVSMADPPSVRYSKVRNVEWDQTFVTSLVGPGGKASVTWKTSIRVVDGKITRNTVD